MLRKKFIEKYAIIEVFPKVLKGSSGISTIFFGTIYIVLSFLTFIKIVFFSGKSKIKKMFAMFGKNNKTIKGTTNGVSYDFNNAAQILAILLQLKPKVAYTEITSYFGKEAKEIMGELYKKGYVNDLDVILSLGTFSIKHEKVFFHQEQEVEKDIFVTREYTEPVIKTLEIKKQMKKCLSKILIQLKVIKEKDN